MKDKIPALPRMIRENGWKRILITFFIGRVGITRRTHWNLIRINHYIINNLLRHLYRSVIGP
jgi:hypothetical protein|tara:strand:- start:351 stop:536 length:186 start_codon:yes stop_codon:yes gene_type:complete